MPFLQYEALIKFFSILIQCSALTTYVSNFLSCTKIEPLKLHLKEKFAEMNSESESKKREIKSRIKDINDKLEKLEEKYVFNDLNPNIYKKHLKKLMDEKNELKKESEQSKIKLSNLE